MTIRWRPDCLGPWRERNRIERFFNRAKHCRRIAIRFEKHAANYLAMLKLAAIRIWLRANESIRSGRATHLRSGLLQPFCH